MGPSTSTPSPAVQEQSVAANRNPLSFRPARREQVGPDPVRGGHRGLVGMGRVRPSGIAMSCPCTSTSMSGSRWLTPGAFRRDGHRAQPRRVLAHRQPGLPDRRVVNHPVEVPPGPRRRDHGGKQPHLGQGEVRGDVAHPPPGAQ